MLTAPALKTGRCNIFFVTGPTGHRLDLMQDRLGRPLRGGAELGLHHADPLD